LAAGHSEAQPAAADVVIVNTCGFIDAAKEESVAGLLDAVEVAHAHGARELVLVGQDTSRWAQPGWGGLERLLFELKALPPSSVWLRLIYLPPDGIDSSILDALARHAVPYVDVCHPLEHASGAVLRRMGRRGGGSGGDGGAYLGLLARIRAALPGVAIRSTFIAGLPGETEEEFEDALAFVGEAGLAAAGVFPYDAQEGTAARLPGQVAADVTFGRASRLSERIDQVAVHDWEAFVGRSLEVLVERGITRHDGAAVGRCAFQAPDIDGRTLVGGGPLRRGQLVHAFAVGSAGYDVEAVAGSREP